MGQLRGIAALQYTIHLLKQISAVTLRDAPALLKAAGVEALLVNQSSVEGGTIADFLEIPFITVCSAVVLNREPGIPPFYTLWGYSPAWWARWRNKMGYTLLGRVAKPIGDLIDEYAPQLELLEKATLMITHAGMNTTMECVKNGVPMVAIPVANDQPGVAARIAWTGAGKFVPLNKLNVMRLREAIKQVFTQNSYKQNTLISSRVKCP